VDLLTYPFGEDVDLPGLRIFRVRQPPFVHDVKIGPSIAKLLLDVPLYFAVARALKSESYDVLHSHEEAVFFGMRLACKHGVRHVYDMHSSLPNQLGNFQAYNLGVIRGLFQWLENRALRTCDGVITICAELAEIVKKQCGEKQGESIPHVMIENTADDTEVFGRTKEDVRVKLELQNKRIVLYTGTFESYQGLDILLKAFARVKGRYGDAHLLMVGGTAEQVERYMQMAQWFGLDDTTTFVGSVHPSRIPAFLEAADMLVSPRSHGKYTPLKIYNYLRSHRPLVATDLFTHTQTLDSSMALLVPATDEGLATGIERLLEDRALGKRLAKAAAGRAEREFSDTAYIAKVAGFYERVMRVDPRPQGDLPLSAER
jgi:glycosyltransferase involved in cell wall biosynthesis